MGKCRHDRRGKRARGNGGGRAPRRAPLALKLASTRKVRALARGRTCASDACPTWHHKACVHRNPLEKEELERKLKENTKLKANKDRLKAQVELLSNIV